MRRGQAQAPRRHPDLPPDSGGGLLLRRQDRLRPPACGRRRQALFPVAPAPELPGLDRDRIRAWYNGYNWLGTEKVYNPFGILKLFRSRTFQAHWFETATPRFLVDTLLRRGFSAPDLDAVHASEALLSSFDVDRIASVAVEEATSRGRVDLSVRLAENVYLFEFKVAERSDPGAALEQLRARGYANKYGAPGRAVHLIGVEIRAASRELAAFDAVTCPDE